MSTKHIPSVDKCLTVAPSVPKWHPLCGRRLQFSFRVHKIPTAYGQMPLPSTIRPQMAPSVWTGGYNFLPRPQNTALPWTNAPPRYHPSTNGTLCVDRRLLFSFRLHKIPPFRGQMPLPSTIRPQMAPTVWIGGHNFPSASTRQ